ncbi:hypothetical protein B0H16DRAFT_1469497 [Mycena metata]|uniref:Uncharacterized protein n=1 Tax=Mycena metata TaxID=1033252 RepID=A0AAD7MSX3_9AGAR|nr:hypothetical protein B0H16DRAFT_1469497 [Mycena metata]
MATTTVRDEEHPSPPLTSTPRRRNSGAEDETSPDFDSHDQFEGPPLSDYEGPVDEEDIRESTPIQIVPLSVPTLRPYAKIANNHDIVIRRNDALGKGAVAIGKEFLMTAQKASRRLYSHVFPRDLELLENVLSRVEKLELRRADHPDGYRVEKNSYQSLLRIAEDSFRLGGKTPPALPSWGNDEDISEVYTPDSFEILGYHNSTERKPQDRYAEVVSAAADAIGNDYHEDTGYISKASVSTAYPLAPASTARFRSPAAHPSSVPNPGLPRNNRRMGEILNPMAPIFESRRQYTGNVPLNPVEADQLRRMTPQGNFAGRDPPPHQAPHYRPRENSAPRSRTPRGAPPTGDPDGGDSSDNSNGQSNSWRVVYGVDYGSVYRGFENPLQTTESDIAQADSGAENIRDKSDLGGITHLETRNHRR